MKIESQNISSNKSQKILWSFALENLEAFIREGKQNDERFSLFIYLYFFG